MASAQVQQAETERLKALRDADDDWDKNAGKSAIEIGKLDVWEQDEAVKNADGTLADTAFDGFMRLGTTREILSWPGNSGETHLVRTEGDEAKAQARLKKERTTLRKNLLSDAAFDKALAKESHRQRESDYARRQRERLEQEQRDKAFEKSARKKAYEQNMHEWAKVDEPGCAHAGLDPSTSGPLLALLPLLAALACILLTQTIVGCPTQTAPTAGCGQRPMCSLAHM